MQLQSFEITNFRAIRHLKCVLSPNITIIAGKNEAGKTTILQALEALNKNWQMKETDQPQNFDHDGRFELKCLFILDDEEKKILSSSFKGLETLQSNTVIVSRSNVQPTLAITGEFVRDANAILDNHSINLDDVKKKITDLNQLLKGNGVPHAMPNVETLEINTSAIQNKINETNAIIGWIRGNKPNLTSLIATMNQFNEFMGSIIANLKENEEFLKKLSDFVPKVVLFSSFNDILPSDVPLLEFVNPQQLEAKNHKIVDDLAKLSGIDRQKIVPSDKQGRANMMSRASYVTSDRFGKYWHQNPIEIHIRPDEPSVLFFIQDQGKTTLFRPEQRSKGLQWYISFFLRLTSEGKEKSILAIDEPGLYLHAKAQSDVLSLLEELSEDNQIIFSTHSPYLIDPSKLGRLRLITTNQKTNDVEMSNFNTNADIETLTPIITAIGLDLTKGFSFPNKKNIVVEGVSDYYYLQAMLHHLKTNQKYNFPDDVVFIPCVGNNNVSTVVSLLHGYGLHYKILLDKKGTTRTRNALIRDGIDEGTIISVGKDSEDSIEDLFDTQDQTKYELVNGRGESKALISRNFYDKITSKGEKHAFSTKTISNFKQLFDSIKKL